jgi:hypothetical protein
MNKSEKKKKKKKNSEIEDVKAPPTYSEATQESDFDLPPPLPPAYSEAVRAILPNPQPVCFS